VNKLPHCQMWLAGLGLVVVPSDSPVSGLPGLAGGDGFWSFWRNLFPSLKFYTGAGRRAEIALSFVGEAGERQLVEAAQADPRRFAELYELHFARVYAYVWRRVGDRDVAEDVTSEVFHHALANLQKFEWRGAPFGAWLMRIASNAVADRWRRHARENASELAEEPVSGEPSPEDVELRAQLFRLVRELPVEQRRVIEMRFAEEKSIREIAVTLGRTEGAVKQLQFRGMQALREQAAKVAGKKFGEAHG
ncbi:MAG: sigma-70 family RNA polymerase sigma factor, partial [Candidatus Acidiferrales bacterium]